MTAFCSSDKIRLGALLETTEDNRIANLLSIVRSLAGEAFRVRLAVVLRGEKR